MSKQEVTKVEIGEDGAPAKPSVLYTTASYIIATGNFQLTLTS
jgi:hypothetical protein